MLPRTVRALRTACGRLFNALDDLGENPNTLLAIHDLDLAVRAGKPGLEFIAPYQTVCNYAIYFLNPLGTHISDPVGGGTLQRVQLKLADPTQQNALNVRGASRAGGRHLDQDNKEPGPNPPATLHAQPGRAGGRLQRQRRLRGRPDRLRGPASSPTVATARTSWAAARWCSAPTFPGLRGGTYKSRQLGIDNLNDVP